MDSYKKLIDEMIWGNVDKNMEKKILYIDMDGVVADFNKAMTKVAPHISLGDGPDYEERSAMVDEVVKKIPNFFQELELMEGALYAVAVLKEFYDVYFLSTPMSAVPHSFMGKREWLTKVFGEWTKKKLILTHRKDLCIGDILIDDRIKNGADGFKGERIHFGSEKFPNWNVVMDHLANDLFGKI